MGKTITFEGAVPAGQALRRLIRGRVREVIEIAVEAELEKALGAGRHEQGEERRSWRKGHVKRQLLTEEGPVGVRMPRGRLETVARGSPNGTPGLLDATSGGPGR